MERQEILKVVIAQLDEKIAVLKADLVDLQRGISEDTKSSAGDKFETAREMAQQEIGKLQQLVAEQQKFRTMVSTLDIKPSKQAGYGSFVDTNLGLFLLGLPFGKLVNWQITVMGIGLSAPMGKALINKQKGDCIQLHTQQVCVLEVF